MSSVSVVTVTHCEFYILRKPNLDKALRVFPEQRDILIQTADLRVTLNSLRKNIRSLLVTIF